MKIQVQHLANPSLQKTYEVKEGRIQDLKEAIRDSDGIPIEYQKLFQGEREMTADVPLFSSDVLLLSIDLKGGDPHCNAGDFECKFRCMCCFSGLDGQWKKCQWFCLKCGI